ncbi:MAG: DUF1634 domain-containing protein [Thermoanaerobaculia bacterium]
MTNPFQAREPRWVDLAISRLLRTGVLLSIFIIATGLAVTFVHHPDYFSSRPALGTLTNVDDQFPRTIRAVVRGVLDGRGQAIASLGLLLLIATPVARVALSIAIFAVEHDRLYVMITTLVLLLLILSFVLGSASG